MRIGIDASRAAVANRTGVEEVIYNMLRELRTLPSSDEYVWYTRDPLPEELVKNLPAHISVREVRSRLGFPYFWTQWQLVQALRRDKPDVMFFPTTALPLLYSGKSVAMIHDVGFYFFPKRDRQRKRLLNWLEQWYLPFSVRWTLRYAAAIMTPSQATKDDLIKIFHGDEKKIHVIPNAIATERFAKPSDADLARVRKQYGLPEKFLLYVGQIETRKNLPVMAKGAALFFASYSEPMDFVIAGGDGARAQEIKEQIRLAIDKPFQKPHTKMLGYVPAQDLPALYRLANVLLYVTQYEGFGIPILEAFASEVPVVTSAISSMPEVAHEAAVLVNHREPEAIAAGIADAMQRRGELVAAGKKRLEDFSWKRSTESLQRLLRDNAKQ